MTKPLIDIFNNSTIPDIPPIWLMRQAGRYLPEYRKIRQEVGGFLNLCYNPNYAAQVTLQPISRYDFDAAIIFADILLICDALGQDLWFVENEGPRLTPITHADSLTLDNLTGKLAPIAETIAIVRAKLPSKTTLIGFAGAPWTVASYMIGGRGIDGQKDALNLLRDDREAFESIIDILITAVSDYLAMQVEAGAEVLQIFESWAASLKGDNFMAYAIAPVAAIIDNLRMRGIDVPIIGFPRMAHDFYVEYARETGISALSIDQDADIDHIAYSVPSDIVLQGNLSPLLLRAGGSPMYEAATHICDVFADRRFIFNLGHGVLPDTPTENVADLVDYIRKTH